MDYFAEQLRHLVFVIVTDDPVWAKSQIPPGFRPVFTGEIKSQIADRFSRGENVKIFWFKEFWQKLMMASFRFLQRVSCRLGGIGLGCSCKLSEESHSWLVFGLLFMFFSGWAHCFNGEFLSSMAYLNRGQTV